MTEVEWQTATDPTPMLEFLKGKASQRKLRLFAVACCWRLLRSVRVSTLAEREVHMAERYADGLASAVELESARCYSNSTAEHACMNTTETEGGMVMADCAAGNAAWAAAEHESQPPDDNGLSPIFNARLASEQASQCNVLRDIFGNPFRPIAFTPAWRTSTAVALAQQMYESRDFSAMPILADALQDAGCENNDVLNHCRVPKQAHVRGCWVVDLVLGKE